MSRMSHWLVPVVLSVAAAGASLAPGVAQAQSQGSDDLIRLLVNASDVIFRSGQPYYRGSNSYGYNDRLVVGRDRYGRPVYYRSPSSYGSGYDRNGYSNGYSNRYGGGYGGYQSGPQQIQCDSRGRCVSGYYDQGRNSYGQYDNRYDNRYYGNRGEVHHGNGYNSGYDRGYGHRNNGYDNGHNNGYGNGHSRRRRIGHHD